MTYGGNEPLSSSTGLANRFCGTLATHCVRVSGPLLGHGKARAFSASFRFQALMLI